MIDRVKNIVFTILNKEKRGPITPTQFNDSCAKAQSEIYSGYFDYETTRGNNRSSKGLDHDIVKLNEQRLAPFFRPDTLTVTDGKATLPTDCYFVDRRGINFKDDDDEYVDIDMVKMSEFRHEDPSETFPLGVMLDGEIQVAPTSIDEIFIDYYAKPKTPRWTYNVEDGVPYFNGASDDYQDFELHDSEEGLLISKIISDFGIIKRESDISQLINSIKQMRDNDESRIL